MYANTTLLEIQFGDCDPAGIVYYPNYFRFFDNATAALFSAALGTNKRAWLQRYNAAGIPMVDTGARFLRPCRFGDAVEIRSQVTELGRSSFSIGHTLLSGGEVVAEAREKRVWTVPDADRGIRAAAIPDEVRNALGGAA